VIIKASNLPRVEIIWKDSHGVSPSWEMVEDVDMEVDTISSVGYVLYEDEECIRLVSNVTRDGVQCVGIMCIPICNIVERYTLTRIVGMKIQ